MVTRKEIAEKAGVSISVVSRALNNSGYVDAEKKKRILEIAEELGYHPNPIAMSLSRNRTKQILFMCKDLRNAFNIEFYEGTLEAAKENDYRILLSGDVNFDRIKSTLVDGMILPNEAISEFYLDHYGKTYYLPVVAASYGSSFSFPRAIPRVECDLWKGTEIIMQYLWDRGHKKIAFISPYNIDSPETRIRVWKDFSRHILKEKAESYYVGITREGCPNDPRMDQFPEDSEIPCGPFPLVSESFFEKGLLAADLFLERKMDATAALCFNDEMAMGFVKRASELGLRIPEDLSVAGIDGVFTSRYLGHHLTTLMLNPREQGRKCVEVLLKVIEGRRFHYVTDIPVTLEQGDTVRVIR